MRGKCGFPECEKPKHGQGWCNGHLQQQRRGEELRPLKKKSRQHYWIGDWKVCPRCGEGKKAEEYSRDKYQPSGRKQYCKGCQHGERNTNKD